MVSSLERPRWIPVGEMVPEGSIGSVLISAVPTLAERLRPETTLKQPFKSGSFSTYGDILKLPAQELTAFTGASLIKGRLEDYLRGLLVLPHSRLLQAASGGSLASPPPGREQEIIEGVEDELNKISYKGTVPVLIWRFGLYDGITRTQAEIGRSLKITPSRVSQIERHGLRILRYRSYLRQVRLYLTMPEASLGRQVFGAVLAKDLPQLDGSASINHLGLPPSILKELDTKTSLWTGYYSSSDILDLVREDLSRGEASQISGFVKFEIALALHRRVREVADRPRREAELREKARRERLATLGEPRNNLMPKIRLAPKQLEILDGIGLEELGLSVHCYNVLRHRTDMQTIGELLRMDRSELLALRNMGEKSLAEVLVKVVGLLKSRFK